MLFFLMYNTEGPSARARLLGYSAIALARDLSMHKTDLHPVPQGTSLSKDVFIETEIKRRLWWYLASSDWYDISDLDPMLVADPL